MRVYNSSGNENESESMNVILECVIHTYGMGWCQHCGIISEFTTLQN